jgi:microcompartment protein CcmK/EutM
VPPVAAGALLWAAEELLVAGDDVGADEVACDDGAAGLLDVVPLAAGFEDEHATRLAITATDSAVVPLTRRPIVGVFTDFLPRLGFGLLAHHSCAGRARVGQIVASFGDPSEPVREPVRQTITGGWERGQ